MARVQESEFDNETPRSSCQPDVRVAQNDSAWGLVGASASGELLDVEFKLTGVPTGGRRGPMGKSRINAREVS